MGPRGAYLIDRLQRGLKSPKAKSWTGLWRTHARKLFATPARTMKAEYVEKQKEYEAKKARAKALKLRLTCTICGTNPKTLLNCPCGTTQCAPAPSRRSRTVGGAARSRRDTDPQVLFDGLSTHRLA